MRISLYGELWKINILILKINILNLTTDLKFTIHRVYLLLTFLLFVLLFSEQSMLTATDLEKIAVIIQFLKQVGKQINMVSTHPVTIGLNSERNYLRSERFLSEEIWESIWLILERDLFITKNYRKTFTWTYPHNFRMLWPGFS